MKGWAGIFLNIIIVGSCEAELMNKVKALCAVVDTVIRLAMVEEAQAMPENQTRNLWTLYNGITAFLGARKGCLVLWGSRVRPLVPLQATVLLTGVHEKTAVRVYLSPYSPRHLSPLGRNQAEVGFISLDCCISS